MEIFLYSTMYDSAAKDINQQISANKKEDITVRINTGGGYTSAGWSIVAMLNEVKGNKIAKVDGDAKSMGAMLLPFFDEVEVHDASDIVFHKAAFSRWIDPSAEQEAELKKINSLFREKLTSKLNDSPKAVAIIEKIFETDVRNDVTVTPQEAVEIGLATKLNILSVAEETQIKAAAMAAFSGEKPKSENSISKPNSEIPKKQIMDLIKLKAEHPALYAEVIAIEKDRVEAWLTNVTAEENSSSARALKGIQDGEAFGNKAMSEMMNLKMAEMQLTSAEEENAEDIAGEEVKPGEDKKKAKAGAEVQKTQAEMAEDVKKFM